MRAIFISYRRDDAEGEAGRLFDDLVSVFGEKSVFMDVAAIEVGRDFRKAIDDSVATCGVLLALIGKDWLDAKNETGQRRLDNPSDFVRLETASALKRDIPVVPVLVRGAKMPRPEQLPDDLKELAYRNGVELTHARWSSDLQLLIKALRPFVEESQGAVASAPSAAAPAASPTVSATPPRNVPEVVSTAAFVPRKKPLVKILAIAAAALVALIIVASLAGSKHVTVPDLTGETLSEATTRLQALHLAVGRQATSSEAANEPNTVLSQSPSSGAILKPGSTVDLVLSRSSEIEVPSLVGKSLDEARDILQDSELRVGSIDREPDTGQPRGSVLRQLPSAGEQVASGAKVDLIVAGEPKVAANESGGGERTRRNPNQTNPDQKPISNDVRPAAQLTTTPAEQVMNLAGTWRNAAGIIFQIGQSGNTFTYSASAVTGMSRGTGTVTGLNFVSSYNSVLVNGVRSTGRCSGTISADGRTLWANCVDSVAGYSTDVLVR